TLPFVSREIAARCGASAVHGPHHEAHTFTTTGFPSSWPRSCRNMDGSNVGSASALDGRSEPPPVAEGEVAVVEELPPEQAVATRLNATTALTTPPEIGPHRRMDALSRGAAEFGPLHRGPRKAMLGSGPPMASPLDAATLRRSMELFEEALRRHRDEINSLNVFPVPDGDTGTNLLLTQGAVVAALDATPPVDLSALGAVIARA